MWGKVKDVMMAVLTIAAISCIAAAVPCLYATSTDSHRPLWIVHNLGDDTMYAILKKALRPMDKCEIGARRLDYAGTIDSFRVAWEDITDGPNLRRVSGRNWVRMILDRAVRLPREFELFYGHGSVLFQDGGRADFSMVDTGRGACTDPVVINLAEYSEAIYTAYYAHPDYWIIELSPFFWGWGISFIILCFFRCLAHGFVAPASLLRPPVQIKEAPADAKEAPVPSRRETLWPRRTRAPAAPTN